MTTLPLRNIRVLELSQIVAGPSAGLILADMGADVIKVEPPDALEPSRIGTVRNGSFFFFNRNKRSIVLDLKKPEGLEIFHRLADRSDVMVENMGPGTTDRLGIGYDQLAQRNPRIIYCSVKGFLGGPNSNQPSLDELAQMMSGLAYMTGLKGQPLRAGASVVDIGAATYAVVGVLGALLERQTTGKGQKITGGLFETALFYVGQHMAGAQQSGQAPQPMGERDRGNRTGGWGVYDLFECSDGRQVFIGVTSNAQWKRLCQALHLEDLAENPDLEDNLGRARNRELTLPRIEAAARSMERSRLVRLMEDNGIPVAPLNTPATVLEEPQVQAPHRLLHSQGNNVELALPTLPYESSDYHFSKRHDAPLRPGRDTREILAEIGFNLPEINRLLKAEVAKVL
ncbi:MAG: CoA transferase [Chloroflexi bacterium]|nr:CoA transferase [Chloroflexota bacterium]